MTYFTLPISRSRKIKYDLILTISSALIGFPFAFYIGKGSNHLYIWLIFVSVVVVSCILNVIGNDLFNWKQLRISEEGLFAEIYGPNFGKCKTSKHICSWNDVSKIQVTNIKSSITGTNIGLIIIIDYLDKRKCDNVNCLINTSRYSVFGDIGNLPFDPQICGPISEIARNHKIKIAFISN